MSALLDQQPKLVAIVAPQAARRLRQTETAAAITAPFWQTVMVDSLGFVLVIWSIPVAIVLVGTPIVMAVALAIALMRWILLP